MLNVALPGVSFIDLGEEVGNRNQNYNVSKLLLNMGNFTHDKKKHLYLYIPCTIDKCSQNAYSCYSNCAVKRTNFLFVLN